MAILIEGGIDGRKAYRCGKRGHAIVRPVIGVPGYVSVEFFASNHQSVMSISSTLAANAWAEIDACESDPYFN